MTIAATITLKKGKEVSIQRFHPWIFSGAIQRTEGKVEDGCWVGVQDYKGNALGFGHFQQGSITVRLLDFGALAPGENFWQNKIQQAVTTRQSMNIPSSSTNAYRLVHGEGDGLPGLIVDMYNGVAVVQAHSAGMHTDRTRIVDGLRQVLGGTLHAVYYKSKGTLPGSLRGGESEEYLFGMGAVPHGVLENDLKFYVDWEEGQKTGFFLDQRDNRNLLAHYVKGKQVLNTFCYTGGFSVYALAGGATAVHSVDASEKAIALTRQNIALNGYDSGINECFCDDVFHYLENNPQQYDVIVLDPPAFAKHKDARHQAVKGYQRLNAEAIKLIKPGGIIFTFSCSQVIDRSLFYNTVVSSAIVANRQVKVLHHLTQGPDHPVSMFHPEGEYLKGLVLYVS
ncbi:MAG: class I SAM-dependent rRNA methyltransferase [Bacteroidia bacterium]|nr:class I SAM-dependent rRNA methyltransferase [Bacteroidia bacterium]